MPDNRINPKTGKRYSWVDPQAAEKEAEEIRRLQTQVKRTQAAQRARDNLLAFTRYTMPDPEHPNDPERSRYEAAPFLEACSKALEDVERGDIRQLIITWPPRHGKTELATKRFAAWYNGRHPEQDIAVASYSDTMAEDFGSDIRAIMGSPAFKQIFSTHKLRRGGAAKSNIQTMQGGRLVAVGRGGALTGRGAHLAIGDDLFKDYEEARSQATRDAAWNWFTKVFMTRRMGKKLVVLTMNRWHSDDIIGRITDPENPHYNEIEASKWKIIRIPAIAEDDDPPESLVGRKPGEALWPERFDLDFLQSQMRLDPLGFATQYQQRPTVADGILFRRENIQRYELGKQPEHLRFYCASDHAVKTGQRNDFSCFGKAGVDRQDNLWLTEIFLGKVTTDKQVEIMLQMASGENRPLLWWAGRDHITGSIGPFLFKRMQETNTYINIREMSEIGDKEQKAQSIAARVALGKVYIPNGLMFDRLVDQMLAFPNGMNDDGVDMMSLFGRGLQSQFGGRAPAQKKERPKFGTLAWVKENDRWAADRKRAAELGGF
jgi:predicted phage terminase large subunit-like protein